MKRLTLLLSLLLLPLLSGPLIPGVYGQDATTDANASDDAKHAAIRQLRDALIKAVNTRDVDSLMDLLDEDVVLTAQDGDQLATIRGRDGVRDYIDRLLIGPDAGVRQMTVNPVVDELTILHGDDAGIAYGSSTDHYTLRDGSEFTLKTRWSATVVRDDDSQWRLGSLHVSTNLFDNPVLDGLKQYALYGALTAALAGCLAGYIAARFLGPKTTGSSVAQESK